MITGYDIDTSTCCSGRKLSQVHGGLSMNKKLLYSRIGSSQRKESTV